MNLFASFLSALFLIGITTPASAAPWDQRIVHVRSGQSLTFAELGDFLYTSDIVVFGEKHNTPEIQEAQAKIIQATLQNKAAKNFVLGWEFLNAAAQETIEKAYARFLAGSIDAREFLLATQGTPLNETYIPVLNKVRELSGKIRGVNLSRKEKAPVVQKGIEGADPRLVPPGFSLGGDFYRERFLETMGGHGDPAKSENYFVAQCLTDDVMAYQLLKDETADLKFLLNGGFHSDYSDGAVARLRYRSQNARLVVLKFVDASDYPEADLLPQLNHPRYGAVADYVVFVKEPVGP